MADKKPIVVMKGITIEFPGVKALDGVNLRLFPGEVHALMGENGAGKSTMIKALTGVYKINAGSIEVDGKPQTFTGHWRCAERGHRHGVPGSQLVHQSDHRRKRHARS